MKPSQIEVGCAYYRDPNSTEYPFVVFQSYGEDEPLTIMSFKNEDEVSNWEESGDEPDNVEGIDAEDADEWASDLVFEKYDEG